MKRSEELDIIETKRAAKDNIIYCVLAKIEEVKEIHVRKATSEDGKIMTRDYIPPQLHARYMAIAAKATERRSGDSKLKTQLRWGEKDVEVYVKTKGSQEPLKKTDLYDFMEGTTLPEYDNNIKWKARPERRQRRNLTFNNKNAALPSLRKNKEQQHSEGSGIIRQHSNSSASRTNKKQKQDISELSSPGTTDTEMEDYETSADV